MLRTGLVGLVAALVVLTGCGGGGDGDFVRFTTSEVQAHYKQQTRFELVRVAKGEAEDLLKPRPSPAANDRYGFFTVHVTKSKGAVDALKETPQPGGRLKTFDNVVVEWLGTSGEDRAPYERSLAVFSSLGK